MVHFKKYKLYHADRIFFILFLTVSSIYGQNYLWPTNASEYMTSSFCEYRPGHYHSAIDIKTWNQEGYPIYAIADGKIERIRVSPFGYGKVLYLKLNDGRTAVYAHLQKFIPKLDEQIFERQIKQERYSVDWYPDMAVKRGEVLGYTGQTGIGVPHLHFEIRDRKNRVLNPLSFYNQVKDHIAPRLQSILVLPQHPEARVRDDFRPAEYQLSPDANNTYHPDQPILVSGLFGMAFRGYDLADGVTNKFAHSSSELWIDAQLVFSQAYDTLDFDLTAQIEVDIHYPTKVRQKKTFNKLYIEPFNELNFYNRRLGNGLVEIHHEVRRFKIVVRDFFGNESVVLGQIAPGQSSAPQLVMLNQIDDLLYLQLDIPFGLKNLAFETGSDSGSWRPVSYFEIINRQEYEAQERLLLKVRLPDYRNSKLAAIYQTSDGRFSRMVTVLDNNRPDLNFNIENLGKYLLTSIKGLPESPGLKLKIITGKTSKTVDPQLSGEDFQYVLPAALLKPGGDTVRWLLTDFNKTLLDTTLGFQVLLPQAGYHLDFNSSHASLTVAAQSLYDTLIIDMNHAVVSLNQQSLPVISPVYRITPEDHLLKNGVELRIRLDELPPGINSGQVGLYRVNGHGNVEFLSAKKEENGRVVSARLKRFGKFAALADTVKPLLRIIQPIHFSKSAGNYQVQFQAVDSLSGIESESEIQVRIDGRFVLPVWDPERKQIIAAAHWKLESGQHKLQLRATDGAGNSTNLEMSFKAL